MPVVRWKGDDAAYAEYVKILQLTGEVAIAWAALESYLAGVLQALALCSHNAADVIYYSPSSFSGRLSILRNLTNHEMPDGPERRLLLRAFERIERLSKARNGFVHSSLIFTLDAKRGTSLNRRVWHPHKADIHSEYRATSNDIKHHLTRLGSLLQLIGFMTTGADIHTIHAWERHAFSTAFAS